MKTNLIIIGVALFAIVLSNGLTHSVMRKEVEKVKAIIEDLDGTDHNISKAFQADSAFLEIYVASF